MKLLLLSAALLLLVPAAAHAFTLIVGAAVSAGFSASTAVGIGLAAGYLSTAATIASIGYSIYSSLNRPKPPGVEGPRMADLSVQSSTRGAPLPKVWGSMRLSGNIIHAKKYEVVTTTETSGGKGFMGGGGGATQTTYSYFADFAISLCEGPITGVRRIWMNNKLWYTAADDASDPQIEASDDNERYGKLYLGTTSQEPDPTLEAIHGAGNVPPYRRTAYIVFTRLPLINFGNAIPQVSVEVCNTPSTFVAPTALCGTSSGGIFGSTNMVRDPDTGRVFLMTFDDAYMRVFDSSMECLALIGLTGKVSNNGLATPCYVPTTREIWGAYNNGTLYPTVAIVDPDGLTLKATVSASPGPIGIGPSFYNPVRDEVIVAENQSGNPGTIYNPHTRTSAGTVNLFGSALCFGSIHLAPHDAIVSWGNDDRIRFVKASDYTLIADLDVAAFDNLLNWVSYDTGRDVLYWGCANSTALYKIDLSVLPGAPVLGSPDTLPIAPSRGLLYISGTDKIYIRVSTGDDIRALDPDSLVEQSSIDGLTGVSNGLYAIDGRRYIIAADLWKVPIRGLLPNSGIPLAEIVEDLCIGAGLLDDDIDVSALNTPTVHGYIRAQPMQATAAISPLMLAYQFDGVESDWLLQFPKRGGSSVATILEDNLGAREAGQEPGAPLVISRQQETDLPTALTVHYREPALSYQQGSQIHRRVYTLSQNTLEIDFPIALTRTIARRLVRLLMNRSWTERTRYQFALGPEYLYLDPGDVVKVESDNATHMVRLDKVDFGAPGLVLCEGVAQRITLLPFADEKADDLDASPIYEDDVDEDITLIVPPDELPSEPAPVPVPLTRLVFLDIPILLDADDDPGFYYAVAGTEAGGWGGSVLFKSIDSGATYAAHDQMAIAAGIGTATTVLGPLPEELEVEDTPTTIWDGGHTVTVTMTSGTLASDTVDNVLAGKNKAALGVDGRWEIIQWRTATLVSAGTYTLSNLLRGRHGTEHNLANHAIGDIFVVLTPATFDRTPMNIGERNLSRHYKAVSFGLALADASAQAFINTGIGLKPYAPVHVVKTLEAGGDITISWVRRTRAVDFWADGVDVPLFEESERYDLEILNGSTVVRTISGITTGSYLYTAAMQTTDFGAAQPFVNVKVYQVSATVGRGYPAGTLIPTSTPNTDPAVPAPATPPPVSGGLKTTFPRLARTAIGSPQNYGTASVQAQLARVDLVILGVHWSWGSISSINSAINAIKAINPDVKVLNYVNCNEVHATSSGQAALRTKLNAQNWWLYPTGGSGNPVPSTWAGMTTANLTSFVPADGAGKKWNTWIAEEYYNTLFAGVSGWDGIMCDNVFWRPKVTGDWNRDGTSEGPNATTATWYRTGMMLFLDHFRTLIPGKMITGNIGDWKLATAGLAMPEYQDELDGGLMEKRIGQASSDEGVDYNGNFNGWGSWALMLSNYRRVMAYCGTSKTVIFNHYCKPTDYKSFRYGFASCLMDNAYYDLSDPITGTIYGPYVRWFDEYDLAGTSNTAWLGTAVDVPPTAAWQNGVWRRRFTGGMVLVNPRGNGARVVTIESGYKRFVGTQDPAVNNGSSALSFSIPDRDGLFLKVA